jgi:hypothetical protein
MIRLHINLPYHYKMVERGNADETPASSLSQLREVQQKIAQKSIEM